MNGDILKIFSNIDLSRAVKLKREAFVALILVIFSVLFYRFIYLENLKLIGLIDSEISSARLETDTIMAEMRSAEGLRKAYETASGNQRRLEGRLRTLKERLPSDRYISQILAEIAGDDLKNGLRVVAIKPLPAEDKGELIRMPFQITLESRFIPFGDYLERIENLPRLMIVDNFMVEAKDEKTSSLTSSIYLSAYVLNYSR